MEVPGLDFVEIELLDQLIALRSSHFAVQIVAHELFVRRMEPETHGDRSCSSIAVIVAVVVAAVVVVVGHCKSCTWHQFRRSTFIRPGLTS